MGQKLNWGIIGTGAIAHAFARGLAQSETGTLAAVGSRSQASADKFGDEFNVPTRHPSYDALLADKNVQAVYISTPHPLHAEWGIKAAEAGKHILCEKPMSFNASQTMAIIEAARRNDVFLMEAFMYRCHPQTAKLVELLKSKVIGDVKMIRATFSFHAGFNADGRIFNNAMAGGGILDVGCYAASMSRLIAGIALGGEGSAEPIKVQSAGHVGQTGVDEYATAILTFPNDIIATVFTGVALNQTNIVQIFGTKGNIVINDPWTANRAEGSEVCLTVNAGDKSEEIVTKTDRTAFAMEADVVGRAIAAGKKQADFPAMNWADTLGNLRTLDQWRAGMGQQYDMEKPENVTYLARGGSKLKVRSDAKMIYGQVPGVSKKVSRLVMGVDNQPHMAHGAVMFDDFFELGGNTFDTGYIYGGGSMEKLLGQWVKNRGIREDVVILDKGAHSPNCNVPSILREIPIMLERLQSDYIDIYMMHRDNPEIPVGEFIDVLNEFVAKGQIKAIGGSNWSIKRVQEANEYAKKNGKTGFVAMSNNFSLARMVDPVWGGCIAASDPESRAWLKANNFAIMPWSSQARGFFTERAGKDKIEDKELVRCWYSDDNFQRRERALEMAKKKNVTPIAIALAYVLNQPFPTFPLIGPRQLSETTTSYEALSVKLTADEVKWLNLEA